MTAPCNGFVPGRHGTCGVCEVPAAEHPLRVRETAGAPDPEEHPLAALRSRALSGRDGIDVYAVNEIARLTEALAAARSERDDNAADRDIYGRERDEARRERNALQDEIDQPHCPRDDAPDSTPDPIPMILTCPACSSRHVDAGTFATKPHHTHACQECGMVWRPAVVATVGVQFLPGFKDGAS